MSGFMDSVEKHWKNIKKNASGQMDKTVEGVKDAGKAADEALVLGEGKVSDTPDEAKKLMDLLSEAFGKKSDKNKAISKALRDEEG
jgi:hypothetical protein